MCKFLEYVLLVLILATFIFGASDAFAEGVTVNGTLNEGYTFKEQLQELRDIEAKREAATRRQQDRDFRRQDRINYEVYMMKQRRGTK